MATWYGQPLSYCMLKLHTLNENWTREVGLREGDDDVASEFP